MIELYLLDRKMLTVYLTFYKPDLAMCFMLII